MEYQAIIPMWEYEEFKKWKEYKRNNDFVERKKRSTSRYDDDNIPF